MKRSQIREKSRAAQLHVTAVIWLCTQTSCLWIQNKFQHSVLFTFISWFLTSLFHLCPDAKTNKIILFVISFNIKFLEFFEERLACGELQEESSMMKDEDEELCSGNPNICWGKHVWASGSFFIHGNVSKPRPLWRQPEKPLKPLKVSLAVMMEDEGGGWAPDSSWGRCEGVRRPAASPSIRLLTDFSSCVVFVQQKVKRWSSNRGKKLHET